MIKDGIRLPDNHKFLKMSDEIAQICQPLGGLKIHHFCYLRKYKNNGEIYLSNQSKWISDYYKLALFKSSLYVNNSYSLKSQFSVWSQPISSPIIRHGREHFSNDIGFTYCYTDQIHTEFFFFAFKQQHYQWFEFCLNNLHLLEHFVIYFRARAKLIIQRCESSKLILPSPETTFHHENFTFDQKKYLSQFNFLLNDSIRWRSNKFKKFPHFTKREIECLNWLCLGKTNEEAAIILNCSKRTVETHINNMKLKLDCTKITNLIYKATRLGLIPSA